jgi:plasmid stability protein
MADVKIRKLEDWVVETHRSVAEKAGRSLEEELRRIVTEAALLPQKAFAHEVRGLQERLAEKYGVMPDSTPLIREDRDRRG